jgi:AI-2 transport protein TqsA
MNASSIDSGPVRLVLGVAALVIIFAGMKAAATMIGPLFFAVYLAVIFGMLIRWLERKGAPHIPAMAAGIILFLAIIAGIAILMAVYLSQLVRQLPLYQTGLESRIVLLTSMAQDQGLDLSSIPVSDLISVTLGAFGSALAGLGNSITIVLLIVITPIFLILDATMFLDRLRSSFAGRPDVRENIEKLGREIIRYLVIRSEVNCATGVGIGVLLAFIGVDFAILWGFLAFLLSFIPYLGFWIAVIPPALLAWTQFGPASAILVILIGVVINEIAENILFPQLAGHELDISPAIVLLSVFFWGWILGIFGALLAVPLTLCLKLLYKISEKPA